MLIISYWIKQFISYMRWGLEFFLLKNIKFVFINNLKISPSHTTSTTRFNHRLNFIIFNVITFFYFQEFCYFNEAVGFSYLFVPIYIFLYVRFCLGFCGMNFLSYLMRNGYNRHYLVLVVMRFFFVGFYVIDIILRER